jgi:hypothetical protein
LPAESKVIPVWQDAEHWSISAQGESGPVALSRSGSKLTFTPADGEVITFALEAGPSTRPVLDQTTDQFFLVASQYPVFHDHLRYRVRASIGIALLAVGQFVILWLLRFMGTAGRMQVTSAAIGWSAVTLWLHFSYLA